MAFIPRLTANGIYLNKYWYSENPFYGAGYGLPNCTCYAWGRYWEVTGIRPNDLPTGNAEDWFPHLPSRYQKSQVPVLGSIACWYGLGSYAGHVAVVEEIKENGDIITSNSGYYRPIASYPPETKSYFWTERCYKNDGYRSGWESSRGYSLQGFIVPLQYADGDTPIQPTRHWESITEYLVSYINPKSENNAYLVTDVLLNRGWTINAVCGVLGNMTLESFISADLTEIGVSPASAGYGLIQWTGGRRTALENWLDTNYTGWRTDLDKSGQGQSNYVDIENSLSPVWIATSTYPISFDTFKISNETPEYLSSAYLYNMERPADPLATKEQREYYARYYYDLLKDYVPGQGDTGSRKRNNMPVWMYPQFRKRRF